MAPSARAHVSDPDAALTTLLQVAVPETGRRFFETFVASLTRALEVHGAWVTEYLAKRRRLRALAFGSEAGSFGTSTAGTLCENGVSKAFFNCAAIPASLIESEFFGHEKGAFTGATARSEGRFALANGGTIFLVEIGELPLDLQPRLLGGCRKASSSRSAAHARDLYYRLNVFPLRVPPLRERGDDVALLASSFVRRFARKLGLPLEPLGLDAIARLHAHTRPEDARELQNVVERVMVDRPTVA